MSDSIELGKQKSASRLSAPGVLGRSFCSPLLYQLLLLLIEYRPFALNVLNQVGVTDVAKDGQIDHVRQNQIIQLNSDSVVHA